MDADEKLMSLKKAYADIILGISKEAAARVMASERKSARYQYELKLAKEEGVRMLLRLKQMMDYQASRAEAASLNQKNKIEELEAQLHEAEDIVRDLREELENVQAELSRVKNENLQHLSEPAPYRNQRNECRKCHNKIVCTCIACVGNQNLPSIILRGKEAGQYRNGCTHRILACEGNLLDRDLGVSEEIDELKHQDNVGKQEAGLRVSSNEVEPKTELGSAKSFEKENNPVDSCHEKTICKDGMNEGVMSLVEVTEASAFVQSPACRLDVEKVDTPLVVTDSNSPDATNGIPSKPARERIIKYTFQRKRKRQAISESKVNGSIEKEKKIGNVQNGDQKLEQAKPFLSMESPRESRRLAQVARQLISLSEKKWWH